MRCYLGVLCTLSVLFAISHAAPANVDLSVSASGSQVIDGVVQNVTSQIFRVVGRVVLRSGIGGGLGGGGESKVSVVLPTFPPDDEDEEDESTEAVEVSSSASIESSSLDESFVRISDSTTAKAQEIALSINEISPETEQTLYTGGQSANPDAERIDIRGRFRSEDTAENLEENIEISTREATTENANDNEIEEDSLNLESTTALSSESTTTLRSDVETEIREKSIDAIFKGIVEVENEIDASTSNSATNTQTEASNIADTNFSIKVLQEGTVVNTIPVGSGETGSTEMSPSSRAKRVVREVEAEENDQDAAASGGNGPDPAEDLSDVEEGDRDKRYSPFGVSGDVHASGGGSGNFLFDIIRQTADGAARAAGTIYRMVAGTENLGIGLSATSTSVDATSQLIAGSGATEETDEKENGAVGAGGVAEIDVGKSADGYTEGIPGPITRLFVIANRGLANLVQDLILRLAQTSERIVNFKARLITALI